MLPQTPSCEPSQIVAGDSVQWTKSLADYTPGDGSTLKYRLIGGTLDKQITADIVTVPGTYFAAFAPADTAGVVAETVARLIGWVELAGGDKETIYDAVVTVLPNARVATAAELLTHEEKVLAAIETVLEGKATSDIAQYAIAGREVQKMTPDELLRWRGIYAARVWRQRNPGQSLPGHKMRMRAAR